MKHYNVMTAMLMMLVLGWSQPSFGHVCSAACGCPDMHEKAGHKGQSRSAPDHIAHMQQAAAQQQRDHGHAPADASYRPSTTLQHASADHASHSAQHADATQAGVLAADHTSGVAAHAAHADHTSSQSPHIAQHHASDALGDFQLTYADLADIVHTHAAQAAEDLEHAPATHYTAESPCTMSACAPAFTPVLTHTLAAPMYMASAPPFTVHSDDVIFSLHTADLFRPPRA